VFIYFLFLFFIIIQRQNPSIVGGQAQVLVLKPGSNTICKVSIATEPYKT
jgi:hypothetical protein